MKPVFIPQASSSSKRNKKSTTNCDHKLFYRMDPLEQQPDLGLQDFIEQVDAAFRDENMVR